MKKRSTVLITAIALIAILIICMTLYFVHTPVFTLMKISKDVQDCGISGLYPHLTGQALEIVDLISSITESRLFGTVLSFFSLDEYWNTLASELKNVQWNLMDISTQKNHATVLLAFRYDDGLSGTLELSMIRDKTKWKIEEIEFPRIDQEI